MGSHSPCSRRHLIDIKSVRLSQPHQSIVQLVSSGASITLGGERWWGGMATGPCSSELVEPASTGTQMASVPTFYFLFSIYKLPLYRLCGQLERYKEEGWRNSSTQVLRLSQCQKAIQTAYQEFSLQER